SKSHFGFYSSGTTQSYFKGSSDTASLEVKTAANSSFILTIEEWNSDKIFWIQSSKNRPSQKVSYKINDLSHETRYTISINNKIFKRVKTDSAGMLRFNYITNGKPDRIIIVSHS